MLVEFYSRREIACGKKQLERIRLSGQGCAQLCATPFRHRENGFKFREIPSQFIHHRSHVQSRKRAKPAPTMVGKLQHTVFGQDFQKSGEQAAVRRNYLEFIC